MRTCLAHLLVGASNRYAWRVHWHNEGADVRVPRQRLLLRARHDQADVGMRSVGDVTLGAIEDPAIAIGVGPGTGLHGGAVAARSAERRVGKECVMTGRVWW